MTNPKSKLEAELAQDLEKAEETPESRFSPPEFRAGTVLRRWKNISVKNDFYWVVILQQDNGEELGCIIWCNYLSTFQEILLANLQEGQKLQVWGTMFEDKKFMKVRHCDLVHTQFS